MQRRAFMTQSLAASAVAFTAPAPEAPAKRPFLELRRYSLTAGAPNGKLVDSHFAETLIPALNRAGIAPVGAFKLDIGPETPATYLLLPASSPDILANLDFALSRDAAYVKAAASFDTAERPAFRRIDRTVLATFDDFAPSAPTTPRIFQLRTYESPTEHTHSLKVQMFQQAEIEIFRASGLHPVFFGRNLFGASLPSLTYMLTFKDTAELEANWKVFSGSPAWKKLVAMPGNGDDTLIRSITNLILSPKPYSQI